MTITQWYTIRFQNANGNEHAKNLKITSCPGTYLERKASFKRVWTCNGLEMQGEIIHRNTLSKEVQELTLSSMDWRLRPSITLSSTWMLQHLMAVKSHCLQSSLVMESWAISPYIHAIASNWHLMDIWFSAFTTMMEPVIILKNQMVSQLNSTDLSRCTIKTLEKLKWGVVSKKFQP